MNKSICSVDGCDRPTRSIGFCYPHYMRNYRYGTPTPTHPPKWTDLRGERFGTLVPVERVGGKWRCECDCGRERMASAGELNRTGDRNTCGTPGAHPSTAIGYSAAHERVRRSRGKVQEHRCIDCGATAGHWSYDHEDPDEMLADVGSAHLVAFSANPDHYVPRCVSCHKKFDLSRKNGTFAA